MIHLLVRPELIHRYSAKRIEIEDASRNAGLGNTTVRSSISSCDIILH